MAPGELELLETDERAFQLLALAGLVLAPLALMLAASSSSTARAV
jgi:hypothetical protein